MKNKETLRKILLSKRSCLTPEEITEKSTLIAQKVLQLKTIDNHNCILTYCSKIDEVDTFELIQYALDLGKKVMVPLTRGHGRMEWSQIEDIKHLTSGPFGIPEPGNEYENIQLPPIDAPIFVPCLGFTSQGERLGFGGGYYDRFLADHNGIKLGLAFELQHIDDLPTEPHDISLDLIITETGQYP